MRSQDLPLAFATLWKLVQAWDPFSPRGQQTFTGQDRESHSSQEASYTDTLVRIHKAV